MCSSLAAANNTLMGMHKNHSIRNVHGKMHYNGNEDIVFKQLVRLLHAFNPIALNIRNMCVCVCAFSFSFIYVSDALLMWINTMHNFLIKINLICVNCLKWLQQQQ